ncbi:MAG: DNA recombination/repair protein RecA, partial [Chitinophagaceae bacterium]
MHIQRPVSLTLQIRTTMSNAEKLKALKLTMDKIDKDFGKGSV